MPAGRPGGGVSTSIPFSVLDLVPVTEGSDARRAFANMVELAQLAERLGYRRYWLAEHHNMPGIASAATAVLIGHVAGATSTIRVGAGGIMLPNHAPLQVAEQFGTLATLYSGADRPRARAGARHGRGGDACARAVLPGSRGVPGRRDRAAAVLRAGAIGSTGARGAGSRGRGGGVDPGLEPVRRAARRAARVALCVRVALRPRPAGAGACGVSPDVPDVAAARAAAGDAGA